MTRHARATWAVSGAHSRKPRRIPYDPRLGDNGVIPPSSIASLSAVPLLYFSFRQGRRGVGRSGAVDVLNGTMFHRRRGTVPPKRGMFQPNWGNVPQRDGTFPQMGGTFSKLGGTFPQRVGTFPQMVGTFSQMGGTFPKPGETFPQKVGTFSRTAETLAPFRERLPKKGETFPFSPELSSPTGRGPPAQTRHSPAGTDDPPGRPQRWGEWLSRPGGGLSPSASRSPLPGSAASSPESARRSPLRRRRGLRSRPRCIRRSRGRPSSRPPGSGSGRT